MVELAALPRGCSVAPCSMTPFSRTPHERAVSPLAWQGLDWRHGVGRLRRTGLPAFALLDFSCVPPSVPALMFNAIIDSSSPVSTQTRSPRRHLTH